jgi:hypothetical protein
MESKNRENLVDTTSREINEVTKANNAQLSDLKREFRQDMRMKDMRNTRKDELLDRTKRSEQELSNVRESKNDAPTNELKREMMQNQQTYHDQVKNLNQISNKKLSASLAERDSKYGKMLEDSMKHERFNAENQKMAQEENFNINTANATQNHTKSEQALKNRLKYMNETYTDRVKEMNDQNTSLLIGMREESVQDKKIFSTGMRKEFNDKQMDLVKSFEGKQNKIILSNELEKKQLVQENEKLQKLLMETTSKNKLKTEELFKQQEQFFALQKNELAQNLSNRSKVREEALNKEIERVHSFYHSKIEEQERGYQRANQQMTTDYEAKIQELTRLRTTENKAKEQEIRAVRANLLTLFDADKKRLVSQYENTLKSMRVSYQDQLTNMTKYKNASNPSDSNT